MDVGALSLPHLLAGARRLGNQPLRPAPQRDSSANVARPGSPAPVVRRIAGVAVGGDGADQPYLALVSPIVPGLDRVPYRAPAGASRRAPFIEPRGRRRRGGGRAAS